MVPDICRGSLLRIRSNLHQIEMLIAAALRHPDAFGRVRVTSVLVAHLNRQEQFKCLAKFTFRTKLDYLSHLS
jgi:hypothetical protein